MLRPLSILVLLGLWMMHGVSATTNAGCHGVPMLMPTTSTSMTVAAPMSATTSVVRHTPAADAQMGCAETCLSGQPPSSGDLMLGLLTAFILVAIVFGLDLELRRPREMSRRGPPGPVGRRLLTEMCVSRT